MPHLGTLQTWYDDRGFGFIAPNDGGRELFVHISSFPRDGFRPTVGESLWFEVGPGKDGKQQAIRIHRRAVGERSAYPRHRTVKSGSKRPIVVVVLLLIALGGFSYFMYQPANDQTAEPQSASPAKSTEPEPQASAPKPTKRPRQQASVPVVERSTPELQVSPPYQCDGRTRCSQMTSCAEAMFFLRNCPGTEMDGDGDGVPCEQQWCN